MGYRKYIGYIFPTFTEYEVTNDCLIIISGILNKKYLYIPLYQLADHVELKQNLIGRWLGDFGCIYFKAHNGQLVNFLQIKGAEGLMQGLPGLIKGENMRYVDALNKARYRMYQGKPVQKNSRYAKCFSERNRYYFPGFETYFLDQDQLVIQKGVFRKQRVNIYLENFEGIVQLKRSLTERILGLGTISLKYNSEEVILRHVSSAQTIAEILMKTIPQAKINYYAYQAFHKKPDV